MPESVSSASQQYGYNSAINIFSNSNSIKIEKLIESQSEPNVQPVNDNLNKQRMGEENVTKHRSDGNEAVARFKDSSLSLVYNMFLEVDSVYKRTHEILEHISPELREDLNLDSVIEDCIKSNRSAANVLLIEQSVIPFNHQMLPNPHSQGDSAIEPRWMADVRALRTSGAIPDYQGKRIHGDAYDFYKKHYGPWLDVMNQRLIRGVDTNGKLIRGLEYSAKLAKSDIDTLILNAKKAAKTDSYT